jgi:hypothetical protein
VNRAALLVAICGAACGRAHVATCADDLGGAWTSNDGRRWMILDERATLEVFPIFTDTEAPDGVVAAPRVIDLARAGAVLAGTLHRRYERRADACDARVPVHVTACADDRLELVVAEPSPPLQFAPCEWPSPAPAAVLRWTRD